MRRLAALAVCCALLAGAASHALGARDATRQARPSRASADPAGRPDECDRHPPSFVSGDDAHTLKCFHLPDRLVPAKSDAAAWSLGGGRFLVAWRSDEKVSGLRIWRRADASWTRLFNQDKSPPVDYGVSLDDITGDGRTDVLANESDGGSGGCGNRVAFGVDTDRVDPLFRRYVCETDAELHDGLLWFREPIGDCPYSGPPRAHCYGGVRLLIRGWAGRRIVVDQTITRCFRASLEPRRNCRRQ